MTGWPAPAAEAAFLGPAGEFVARTEPHSEAHPMALLAQFLVAFGCACGRGAHYRVEADRHYSNEFIVLVGPTATGRKGSSWGHVRRLLEDADPGFARCLVGGLSSGEGLIAQVRDPVDKEDARAPSDTGRATRRPTCSRARRARWSATGKRKPPPAPASGYGSGCGDVVGPRTVTVAGVAESFQASGSIRSVRGPPS